MDARERASENDGGIAADAGGQRQENRLTRRELLTRAGLGLAAVSLAPLAACAPVAPPQKEAKPAGGGAPAAPAVVKGQTMAAALWAGLFSQVIRDVVVPDFEKDHGVKVDIDEGNSSAISMAKIRATRGKPTHTVLGVDDQYVPELRAEGLIVKLTAQDVPNMKDMYPEYLIEDGWGLGIAASWASLYYNTEKIKAAPTSYAAMWDPGYKARVAMLSLKAGTGFMVLAAAASLVTGKPIKEAQYQADVAFPKLKELAANAHSISDSSNTFAPLLAQGEVWLAFSVSRIQAPYSLKGAPVARAEAKEGSFLLLNSITLVANSPLQEQGKDFINRIVSVKTQLEMSKAALTGPVNRKAEVPADLRKLVPSSPEDVAKVVPLDWSHVIKNRAGWLERFDKEIMS